MSVPQFGSLKKVDLRDCWEKEDRDFTPWLAEPENIRILGKAIGCEMLEVIDQEAGVGRYSADILCRDDDDDSFVVIENQLEKTDHSHLGQLITYAAGLDAKTMVWIVKEFTEEHRAALDWLNLHTDSGFQFFGVVVEVYKIGDSEPAPRFEVVSAPNDWTKSTRQSSRKSKEVSELQAEYLNFWNHFVDEIDEESGLKKVKPRPRSYMRFNSGGNNTNFNAKINFRDNWIQVDLYLKRETSEAYFHLLEEQRDQIESELGYALNWEDWPNGKSRGVLIRKEIDTNDPAQWEACSSWLIKNLISFGNVFKSRIKDLDANEWQPEEVE